MDVHDIINKLSRKGVTNRCEKCGGEKQLSDQPVQVLGGSGGSLSQTHDGYAMFCNNCGHLDIFSAQYLQ